MRRRLNPHLFPSGSGAVCMAPAAGRQNLSFSGHSQLRAYCRVQFGNDDFGMVAHRRLCVPDLSPGAGLHPPREMRSRTAGAYDVERLIVNGYKGCAFRVLRSFGKSVCGEMHGASATGPVCIFSRCRVLQLKACVRWQRDAGLRLDQILLNPQFAPRLRDAGVDRSVRGRPGASDHAPVWAVLDRNGRSASR